MTEVIRSIVTELGKEPFKKSFSVISFDSLKSEQLLQVLNDVLSAIDPLQKVDIREENPEETGTRMLNFLRVLNFKGNDGNEMDPNDLRASLVAGEPKIIHAILDWLLKRLEDLKTKAYLAKFLVKVDIPQDIRTDIEVEELFQQYEERMDLFKSTHRQLETLKKAGLTTSEIRKDIAAMEQEQDSVSRKIEKLKRQVEGVPNTSDLLEVVRTFRKEKEKARDVAQQHVTQNQLLNQMEQRVQRLQRQLKEVRSANQGATAEGLLQRLEQDVSVAQYIVGEKLPKEIDLRKKDLLIYERVMSDGSLSQRDIEELQDKIERVKKEINDLVMRRMMKNEDNNLLMYRQQAAIVSNRKETLVEKLRELRSDMTTLKEEEDEKRGRLGDAQIVNVKEDDFKEYVRSLRIKSTRYKQMKAELAYLKNESGVLSKTIFVLEEQLKSSSMDVSAVEAKLGIKGFTSVQGNLEKVSSEKGKIDEKKSQNLQQMSASVQELHDKINTKKIEMAPIIKNLNGLRQQVQILGHDHEAAKRRYDGVGASVESSLSSVVREVESMRKRHQEDLLRFCKIQSEIPILTAALKRVQEEMRNYTANANAGGSGPTQEIRKKSYKEQLAAKILEQERSVKVLKDEEKEIAEKQEDRLQQAIMWKDLYKILQLKKQLRERTHGK